MKWIKMLAFFLLWFVSLVVASVSTLYLTTRPTKKIQITSGEYFHATGRYCALLVEEDRDWRQLPQMLFDNRDWKYWRASVFVGRDCEKRQDQGIWTDLEITWGADTPNQIDATFSDAGYTLVLHDGRSLFVPRALYLQPMK